jgi:hypothetical protein
MTKHEFFAKYANLPLEKRNVVIDFDRDLTLHDIYIFLNNDEEKELLEIAEQGFKRLEKTK